MFGSRVGFSGSENRMALFPFRSNARWWPWHGITWHDKKEDIDKSRAMSPFILATAILDFWRMSSRRHTIGLLELAPLKILTVKTWALGIAVGILLLALCHCALEVEICLESKIFTPRLPAKIYKLLPGQGFYNMPIFILSAAKTIRLLSRHILSKMLQFSPAAIEVWKVFPVEKPSDPCNNKKAVLPQGNRAMLQVFFSVEVRQQHSLQV